MKSNLVLSVIFVLLAFPSCGAPSHGNGTSPTGGATSTGGGPASGGSGEGSGGAGSGGIASSGGAIGQGGSGGNSSPGAGGSSNSGGSGGGDTSTSAKGGNAGSGGANPGGTSAKGGGAGSGGANPGGTSAKGGGGPGGSSASSGGSSGTTVNGGSGAGGATGPAGGSGGSGGSNGGSGGTVSSTGPNPTGPCDIYQAANTPCGAAHSTVRALYSTYTGPLYQVQKGSSTKDIMVGSGGFANSADQDSFCSGSTCTIPIIYDQSGNGNHLYVTFWAYWLMSGGNPATANAAKITVGGHTVYGIKNGNSVAYHSGVLLSGTASVTKGSSTVTFSNPQTLPANTALLFVDNTKDCPMNSYPNNCGYKANFTAAAMNAATTVTLTANYNGSSYPSTRVYNASTKGIATGDQAEAEYAILDGKTYGTLCCFDYGAAEMTGFDEGNATMEAISWGATNQFGQSGGGSGPWIAADIENGMYEGGSNSVPSNTSITGFPYVTLMLKGLSAKDCPAGLTNSGCFALKAGNAQSGKLAWKWDATTSNYGARPAGYSPQKKQGAIILGTGGDGSNTGVGIWFEGAMTMGAPLDSVDDQIQANIVAAGYGK